ncbi:hypothetical protein MKEN_00803600 [Mycena kentingensis (nom. inval.)]|nr:hypothetical protein MKEN_00803600 [Mycena kentingensis (nom. inval.)]
MASSRERRWTAEEDELLLAAVANLEHEHDNWKTVAQAVPGRSNKACRKRWLHSLSPTIKKSAWTPEEDELLISLFGLHGPKWSIIARQIRGRTDDACSKRYREALDPNLKKDEWTTTEDAKLLDLVARLPGKWGQIGQELRRSGLGCRNRYRLLERNRLKMSRSQPALTIPYYSPTDYDLPADSVAPFRPPTPQMPARSPVMPFNFSSSSLVAALSDPPRPSVPLPSVTEDAPIQADESMDVDDDQLGSPTHSASPPDSASPTPPVSIPSSAVVSPLQHALQSLPGSSRSSSAAPSPTTPSIALFSTISPLQMYIREPPAPLPQRFTSLVPFPRDVNKSPLSTSLLLSIEPNLPPNAAFSDGCSPSSSSSPMIASLPEAESPKLVPSQDFSPTTVPAESVLFATERQPIAKRSRQRGRASISSKLPRQSRLSCLLPASSDPELRAERRTYICTHQGCFKAYRQPSGLRYHLLHGHANTAQLDCVPPTIARDIEKRTRKMRRKGML